MRIIHVFPRIKEVHGGAEPVLFNLLKCLSDLGVENTLVTNHIPENLKDQLDARVRLVTPPSILSPDFSNVLMAGFSNLISTIFLPLIFPRKQDVVCFHTETVVPALFSFRLFNRRTPAIYFCYQPPRFAYDTGKETKSIGGFLSRLMPLFSTVYKRFDNFTVKKADSIFTFSRGYKDWIERIYGLSGVKVIPPGVSKPDNPTPIPAEIRDLVKSRNEPVLVFVGKLVPWKNVDRLINITRLLHKRGSSVTCLLVGDGPCMVDLKKQVATLGLNGSVIFAGYVKPEDVFSYYLASDLFVLLEKNVSFGLSIVEANAMGLPVLAFEGGGPSDIIDDGNNGFLIPPNETDEQITARIENILGSREIRLEMREHALEAAGRFTWEAFATRFLEFTNSAIQSKV